MGHLGATQPRKWGLKKATGSGSVLQPPGIDGPSQHAHLLENLRLCWAILAASALHSPASCSCKDSRRSLLEDNEGLGSGTNTAPAMLPAPRIRCFSSSQLALLPSPSPRDDTVTDQLSLRLLSTDPAACSRGAAFLWDILC
jgi:hypothetical protein